MAVPVTCVHGTDEKDSACPTLKGPGVRVVPLGRWHHFGGNYERLVDLILGSAARR